MKKSEFSLMPRSIKQIYLKNYKKQLLITIGIATLLFICISAGYIYRTVEQKKIFSKQKIELYWPRILTVMIMRDDESFQLILDELNTNTENIQFSYGRIPTRISFFSDIYPVAYSDKNYGYIYTTFSIFSILVHQVIWLGFLLLTCILFIYITHRRNSKLLMKALIQPLENIHECLYDPNFIKNFISSQRAHTTCTEILHIDQALKDLCKNVTEQQAQVILFEKQSVILQLAQQVAHDIRSPLAALNVISKDLSELPEEKRLLLRAAVQRIDDIANDLSQKKHVGATQQGEHIGSPLQDDGDSIQNDAIGAGSQPAKVGAIHELPLPQDARDVYLLSGIIEPLISEKRLQHRSKINVEICSDLGESSYGLFAKVDLKEFKRMLSNLINNAVEVFEGKGQITVSLCDVGANLCVRQPVGAGPRACPDVKGQPQGVAPTDAMIQIQIKDNGKGIPPEILSKLAQRGNTFGKEGGSGLGLYHAKTTVEKWGGDLKIESIYVGADRCVGPNTGQTHRSAPTGSGTVVTILLKKEPAPDWFVADLRLQDKMTVVIVDDDNSIHQVWNGRLHRYIKDKKIEITHLANPDALREWVENHDDPHSNPHPNPLPRGEGRTKKPPLPEGEGVSSLRETGEGGHQNMLFLCDYEFLGCKQNGLDVIEELQIQKNSILVTSRYEEGPVRERCARLKIKLIPKPLAGFVPIEMPPLSDSLPQGERENKKQQPDYIILIDDEKMIHTLWRISGKEIGTIVHAYLDLDTFIPEAHLFSKDTLICIDSNLGKNQKGEEVAKQLYEMGFRNIYLTTGSSPKDFPNMPWIKKIIGKEPPWGTE